MAHEIDMSNGRANMMFVGQKPWHNLGTEFPVGTHLTWKEARKAAGLEWEPGLCNLQTVEIKDGDKVIVPAGIDVETKGVYRNDTGAIIGNVGNRTTLLLNSKAFEFFDPFVQDKSLSFETAGSLKGGAIVWVLAKLASSNLEIVKGDEISRYLLLSNSHNGKMSVRVGFNPVRVVCFNTLSMSHNAVGAKMIRLRHSSKVEENLEDVRDIINLANQSFEATAEQYRSLARKQINSTDLKKYVKIVLIGKDILDKDVSTRTKNTIDKIIDLFETGIGSDLKEGKGTYWRAYNSVNEYLNYSAGRGVATRMDSLWFGANANTNAFALETALEMAV